MDVSSLSDEFTKDMFKSGANEMNEFYSELEQLWLNPSSEADSYFDKTSKGLIFHQNFLASTLTVN